VFSDAFPILPLSISSPNFKLYSSTSPFNLTRFPDFPPTREIRISDQARILKSEFPIDEIWISISIADADADFDLFDLSLSFRVGMIRDAPICAAHDHCIMSDSPTDDPQLILDSVFFSVSLFL
jgi:hypothetical protein